MSHPVLQVRNLRTCFGSGDREVVAVDDVSFDVQPGEILGVVGESGCGKSVTASSILRLVSAPGRVAGGEILFNGRDVMAMSAEELRRFRGNDVSMIFQDPMSSLNPVMKVGAQIREAMLVHGLRDKEAAAQRAGDLMAEVHIPAARERVDDYPHQFSGGMRQRIMIAMGLANEPSLLLADEPTTALDVTVQAQIMDLMRELNAKTDTAIMLITHNIAVVANLCTRMMVMYAGKVVEAGPTEQVLSRPQHPYTWSLLRTAPQLGGERKARLLTIEGMPPNLADLPTGCRFQARCPFVTDRCRESEPVLESVAPDQSAACYRPMATIPAKERHAFEHRSSRGIAASTTKARAANAPDAPSDAQPSVGPVLMRVNDVRKTFELGAGISGGKRTLTAVDGVTFDIRQGETLGLVGESGCGKSTLGRVLLNLEPASDGSIEFEGRDITRLRGRAMRSVRRDMQMVFQDSHASLNPRHSVERIIAEPLQNLGRVKDAELRARVAQVMEVCGLPTRFMRRYPHEFSGGQRQRIGIARALILRPKLVVADEPISALDVSIQAQIVNLLQDLQHEFALTYVLISHDLSVVRHIADRVAVMYLGKIVELASSEDLYERPRHPYTRMLLDAIPRLDGSSRSRGAGAAAGRKAAELPSPLKPPSGCRFHTRCPLAQPGLCDVVDPPLVHAGGRAAACHLIDVPTLDNSPRGHVRATP
jgi:peptide/nickel transport system ATP-binding protein